MKDNNKIKSCQTSSLTFVDFFFYNYKITVNPLVTHQMYFYRKFAFTLGISWLSTKLSYLRALIFVLNANDHLGYSFDMETGQDVREILSPGLALLARLSAAVEPVNKKMLKFDSPHIVISALLCRCCKSAEA